MYVGGGKYDGHSSPARINTDGLCTFYLKGQRTQNTTNCFYLKKLPYHFGWLRIGYINDIVGAVRFRKHEIGRIHFENGKVFLGKVKKGFLYYDIHNKESKTGNYEILVFKPLRRPLSIERRSTNKQFEELFEKFKAAENLTF